MIQLPLFPVKPVKLFLDLDGVFADFNKGIWDRYQVTWPKGKLPQEEFDRMHKELFDKIRDDGPEFWENLELLPDALHLYDRLHKFNHEFLTAWPRDFHDTQDQLVVTNAKSYWVLHDLSAFAKVNTCYAKDKKNFVDPEFFSILIDDHISNIEDWISAGGIGIHHINAVTTLYQLSQILRSVNIHADF